MTSSPSQELEQAIGESLAMNLTSPTNSSGDLSGYNRHCLVLVSDGGSKGKLAVEERASQPISQPPCTSKPWVCNHREA